MTSNQCGSCPLMEACWSESWPVCNMKLVELHLPSSMSDVYAPLWARVIVMPGAK